MLCVVYCVFCVFFFFKQKTAYEMRISDWSSDVCSSDLPAARATPPRPAAMVGAGSVSLPRLYAADAADPIDVPARTAPSAAPPSARAPPTAAPPASMAMPAAPTVVPSAAPAPSWGAPADRKSTRQLQSLMRNSYAVFC